jgi:hypothetical protein
LQEVLRLTVRTKQLSIQTKGEGGILDITSRVAETVIESKLKDGIVTKDRFVDVEVTVPKRAVIPALRRPSGLQSINVSDELDFAVIGRFPNDQHFFIKSIVETWWFTEVYGGSYFSLHSRLRLMSYDKGDSLLISERFFMGGPKSLRGYEVGSVSPRNMSSVVVFPLPVGPRTQRYSPLLISRSTSSMASTDQIAAECLSTEKRCTSILPRTR